MLLTISITIKGNVQGVFFRQSTRAKAWELDITGFVKNMPDETVQVIASGTKEQLDDLVSWCRQGPPRAAVTDVLVKEQPFQPFADFTVDRSS